MDDLERQVIDAILDGDPGETVMETPGDKWVSLKHIYPRIAAALRAVEYKAIAYQRDQNACHFNAFRKPKIEREEIQAAGLAALKGGDDG